MIEPEILDYLLTATTSANRFYLNIAPQTAAMPYCVITKIAPGRDYTHDGASGLHDSVMQVSCFAKTYQEVKNLAWEVVDVLESWTEAQAVFLQSEADFYEEDSKTHHIPLRFIIWHDL